MERPNQDEFERFNIPLDPEGKIIWERIAPEKLEVLAAGPGLVLEPAEQEEIHNQSPLMYQDDPGSEPQEIMSSSDIFRRNYNNFALRFGTNWLADLIRQSNAYYQRFSILFPELEAEVKASVAEDRKRMAAQKQMSAMYNNPPHDRLMQFAFGIMSQLVDEKDDVGDGTLVRNSPNRRIMLTV
jgi:hypothetical protein